MSDLFSTATSAATLAPSSAAPAALNGRRAAWQRIGNNTLYRPDKLQTSAELIETAGLAFRVEKEPMQLMDGTPVPNNFALVRQDTRRALSVVGNDYQPLQNVEAFSFLDSLMMDGVLKYQAALTIKGGQCLALIARLPSADEIAPGDFQHRDLLLTNWHGGGSIGITPISFRVFCANQSRLIMDTGRAAEFKIKHTGDIAGKLRLVRLALAKIDRQFTQYTDDARRLLVGHTREQAAAYMAELFPTPAECTERSRRAVERKIAQVREAWRSPAQQAEGVRGTWWALYNAVTEAVDHATPARQSRNVTERLENRFVATTTGDGARLKTRAFELALAMSA